MGQDRSAAITASAGAVAAQQPLIWHKVEVGWDCDANVVADQPRDGKGSLRLATLSDPKRDEHAWMSVVRVEVKRADGQPLGSLEQLADGGTLSVDFYRSSESGGGMPIYSLPWVGLRVRTADGDEAVLLWESAYNGYPPASKTPVPQDEWIDDVRIATGTFWMRYQGRSYNGGKGFQKLKGYVEGGQATTKNLASLQLDENAQIVAVEFGSGPNLSGRLLAYVDDLKLSFAGGQTYHRNFEP